MTWSWRRARIARSRSATASWWAGEEAMGMSSAIVRKSVTDLSRRKARTFFTTLTLALPVASIGLFAVPTLMQRTMDREITTGRLADVTLTTRPVVLSAAQLQRLEQLPNV